MFGTSALIFVLKVTSVVLPRSGAPKGSEQRGAAMLAMALIALLVGTSLAAPAVNLVVGSFSGTAGVSASIDARSAAEHALWRLRYDPLVHDEMIG
jgi:hypothetical protein